MANGKSAIIGLLAVILIITAVGFGIYYQSSNDLRNQLLSVEANPSTVTDTVTSTSFTPIIVTETDTSISVSSSTVILTQDVYPAPENVTVFFTQVNGDYNYAINAGSISYTGGSNQDINFSITPSFKGEAISITAGITAGIGGCFGYNQLTASLYVNSTLVSKSSTVCGTSGVSISYVL